MSTIADIVSESRLEYSAEGYRVERRFIVTDISGSADGRLYAAMLASGVPRVGDFHPVIPGLQASRVTVSPIDPAQADVTVEYAAGSAGQSGAETAETGGWILEFSTNSSTERVWRDAAGNVMYDSSFSGSLGGTLTTTIYAAEVIRPRQVIRARRGDGAFSRRQLLIYGGQVNLSTWNGYAPRTWLCSGLTGSEADGYTLEFSYNELTWDFETTQTFNTLGAPQPTNIYVVYKQADFSPLGITF